MPENERLEHLLIVPDGNRRFATRAAISYSDAYRLAADRLVELVDWWAKDDRLDELTLGILTTHNFYNRPPDQILESTEIVMNLIANVANAPIVKSHDLKLSAIGDRGVFFGVYQGTEAELDGYLESSKDNKGKKVNISFAYNPEKDLAEAVMKCVEQGVPITFKNIANRGMINPVTFSIRTGYPPGFNKLSCYSPGVERARLYSTPTPIQEFTQKEFKIVVDSYINLEDCVDQLSLT